MYMYSMYNVHVHVRDAGDDVHTCSSELLAMMTTCLVSHSNVGNLKVWSAEGYEYTPLLYIAQCTNHGLKYSLEEKTRK